MPVAMAVEEKIKVKRKRKHDDVAKSDIKKGVVVVEEEDKEELVVPEKQKKDGTSQLEEKNASGHSQKPSKTSNSFNMLDFRTKLRGNNFITELRHFLELSVKRPQLLSKYLEKRGKPLELAESMERIDKTNIWHVSYICEALRLILLEIQSKRSDLMESAVYASRYFIKSHATIIESLLKPNASAHNKKIALKLLTAMVCIEPGLGRIILSTYPALSNSNEIKQFLAHNQEKDNNKQQSHKDQHESEENLFCRRLKKFETIRQCYIEFVLAYLIDGNTLLIRNILDRGGIIRDIIAGLVYDDAHTVCVFLVALQKYVLECPEISKTKKIHVFDVSCCKSLARLYDWRGRKFISLPNKSKEAEAELQSLENDPDYLRDREEVSKAVHQLLLTLLTSRKHGIAFDIGKHLRFKRNNIQSQVIPVVFRPWSCPLKTELILKILENCPDLLRNAVRHFVSIVNPLRTGQKFFVVSCKFLIKVIEACHPSFLQRHEELIDSLTLTDFTYWIKDICLPVEALVHIKGAKLLMHTNFEFRLVTNRLLLTMFNQYINYMRLINRREQIRCGKNQRTASSSIRHNETNTMNSLRKFKFDILTHLLTNFPTIEDIVGSLSKTVEMKQLEDVDVLAHLSVALDLILAICQENRTFVDRTSVILDYLELLRPLYTNNDDRMTNIKLEMKAIKTILLLFPKALEPQKERFESVLNSFIKAFVYGNADVSEEAGLLLRSIFRNTGLFDSGELEIDLWLELMRLCDEDALMIIVQVFNEVFKVTSAEVEMPKINNDDIQLNTTDSTSLRQLFINIERGLVVQSYTETVTISKLMPLIFKGVDIEEPLDHYLEMMCLALFHYYPVPEFVLKLYEMQFHDQKQYMTNWLTMDKDESDDSRRKSLRIPPKYLQLLPKMREVDEFLTNKEHTVVNIFCKPLDNDLDTLSSIVVDWNGSRYSLTESIKSERVFIIYIQHVLFQVIQLYKLEQLTRSQAERGADFLIDSMRLMECIQRALALDEEMGLTFTRAMSKSQDDESSPALCLSSGVEKYSVLEQLLKYIYGIRLNVLEGQGALLQPSKVHLSYLHFLRRLTDHCRTIHGFDELACNYKWKLVKIIAVSFQGARVRGALTSTVQHSEQFNAFVDVLKAFQLNFEQCLEILNLLMVNKVEASDYFTTATTATVLTTNAYYKLLVFALERLAELGIPVKCQEFITYFCAIYTKWYEKKKKAEEESHTLDELNLEQLDEACLRFFAVNHQYLQRITKPFFATFFNGRRLSKMAIRLVTLIYQRTTHLNQEFLVHLPSNLERRELVYPLLNACFRKRIAIDESLLQAIYQSYRNGFMRTIEKPHKAANIYKENVACTLELIERCMPPTECRDFCCSKQWKFDSIDVPQIRTVYQIYKKAYRLADDGGNDPVGGQRTTVFVNYIQLQIQMLSIDLKSPKFDALKWELMGHQLWEWFNMQSKNCEPTHFSKILKSPQWMQLCKGCLKTAMRSQQQNEEEISFDHQNGFVLRLLALLCDQLYPDYVEGDEGEEYPEPSQLFEMITTHSKYQSIVLSTRNTAVKTEIMHLLLVLAKKSPSSLQEQQIPFILGAYQGQLTDCDRYILPLLNLYETHDCGLEKYKPFVWGESAIAFYALKASAEDKVKLQQQETSIEQVMALIDRQICFNTLENFPIWRRLNSLQQLPEQRFSDPLTRGWRSFGTNRFEREIEGNSGGGDDCGKLVFEKDDLRLCPKKEQFYDQCYDPAFFVPLMCMCFAPESCPHPARPVQNGLLSLCFAALSSQDKEMRQAAGCVQIRYRQHFENSKFFEKPLWSQIYENFQIGLNELRLSWIQHRGNTGIPRVPYISGLFVARSILLTTDPTHLLYKPLTMYLRLKNNFNFQCIPEFNVLFYSTEVEHQRYRQFILNVIRHGIKCSGDLFLLVTTNTFKVLMSFYGSSISTLEHNLLILSIFSTCVKIPDSCKIMIENVGVLSWLMTIVAGLEFYEFDIIEGLISIVNNLWYALEAQRKHFHNYLHLQREILRLITLLLPSLSSRISIPNFAKLMNILLKTTGAQETSGNTAAAILLSKEQLSLIIDCAEIYFGSLILPIRSIFLYGGEGALCHEDYCQQLHDDGVNTMHILALSSIRNYLLRWTRFHAT